MSTRPLRYRRRNARNGTMLLEVLLACTLLAISLTMLSLLGDSGRRLATNSQLQSRAAIRCETIINELVIGSKSLSEKPVSCKDDPAWCWVSRIDDHESGMKRLVVTVYCQGPLKLRSQVEMIRLLPPSWQDQESKREKGFPS